MARLRAPPTQSRGAVCWPKSVARTRTAQTRRRVVAVAVVQDARAWRALAAADLAIDDARELERWLGSPDRRWVIVQRPLSSWHEDRPPAAPVEWFLMSGLVSGRAVRAGGWRPLGCEIPLRAITLQQPVHAWPHLRACQERRVTEMPQAALLWPFACTVATLCSVEHPRPLRWPATRCHAAAPGRRDAAAVWGTRSGQASETHGSGIVQVIISLKHRLG